MITYGDAADVYVEVINHFHFSTSDTLDIILDMLNFDKSIDNTNELRKKVFEYAQRLENS